MISESKFIVNYGKLRGTNYKRREYKKFKFGLFYRQSNFTTVKGPFGRFSSKV